MSNNNQSLQVVNAFLTAVQQGDFEKVGSLLHPEIVWQQPGNNPFSGTQTSAADVFKMVGGMFQHTANNMALTAIKTMATHGESVACLLHWSATHPSGKEMEVDNIDVYTVRNGQIVAAVIYTADEALENMFWNN
ncbi:nuclear transport factor 2 family protein [Deminuibacter soli]|uniref:Nuclear transport factor 2 family protein n=1 Tax=Deminuibacter soli TaxID=2291815 RepID=A0A3E1NRK0_9BACT|nr:nuclear transport factor 2 family protein [Deminuibacter soli]RFM30537.1 nuclear transport factor 2 family protein [Deminuibacter soli]